MRGVQEKYLGGGRVIGGANHPVITKVTPLPIASGALAFRIDQVVTHEAQTIVDAHGAREERATGANRFTAYVLWVDDHWRLDVMELR